MPVFLLSEFVFPNLKSLVIDLSRPSLKSRPNIDLFWKTIQTFTGLELLKISGDIVPLISFSQWLTLSQTLSKLRYLLIAEDRFKLFDDSKYYQLFKDSSTLQVIFHGGRYLTSNSVKYFKDIIANTVQSIQWPHNNRFFPIDNYKLNYKFPFEGIPQKFILYLYKYL